MSIQTILLVTVIIYHIKLKRNVKDIIQSGYISDKYLFFKNLSGRETESSAGEMKLENRISIWHNTDYAYDSDWNGGLG